GMGGGDVKLAAMMGAFLGWKLILAVLFLSSLVGGLFGIGLILLRKGKGTTPIPFGVFLAPVGFLALLYGEPCLAWYLGLGAGGLR
ncbi:MAG: A24 family peptidase, partial [Candidatus Eisenbacteria bacterium]